MSAELNETDLARRRHSMVGDQLRRRHITDRRVLAAMEKIPRHLFVPPGQRHAAYEDGPLSIGAGQTISQPYIVARMTELLCLTPTDRVLEIGTGSGYQAAVLAELAGDVWTIERHVDLAEQAEARLTGLGYHNVHVITGDGSMGLPEHAPYDAIVVTAAAPFVPDCLKEQLAMNGRMVIPVASGPHQDLRLIERVAREEDEVIAQDGDTPAEAGEVSGARRPGGPCFRETSILTCVFVPLIGEHGYPR
ncbi:MAG: protein-L-isoaspartate(D-aspartate) O-methyltransferase [Actinobacteria bacterium]|jgi:protein-L-isoaspartate(D-aspartate) O-methyltransferase|nr:protein-L-isoaspartate(D-aspartate) O-methyltransferase [Actinomycetota bacterium]